MIEEEEMYLCHGFPFVPCTVNIIQSDLLQFWCEVVVVVLFMLCEMFVKATGIHTVF